MSAEQVKRNRYAGVTQHSPLSHAQDYENFHVPLARMHHAALHGPGVAQGLAVKSGATGVLVEEGIAVDAEGRLIALAKGTGNAVIWVDPTDSTNFTPADVPVLLDTSGFAGQAQRLYVTIEFYEKPLSGGTGGQLAQGPYLRLQPATDPASGQVLDPIDTFENGTALVLAIITTDEQGQVTALKAADPQLPYSRHLVGQSVEGLGLWRAVVEGDTLKDALVGTLEPDEAGGLHISTGLSVAGSLRLQSGEAVCAFSNDAELSVNGALAVPTQQAVRSFVSRRLGQVQQALEARVDQALSTRAALEGSPRQDFSARLLTAMGRIGVGTATPQQEIELVAPEENADLRLRGHDQSDVFMDVFSGRKGGGLWHYGDVPLSFATQCTERMTILGNGNVGIGTTAPSDRLDLAGEARLLSSSNPIRFTAKWSRFPDEASNRAEISNDTGEYKALMIVGNSSAGMGRRVSVWDRLEVNGSLLVTEATEVRGLLTALGNLSVNGNIAVTGTVDGRDVSADGGKLDAHISTIGNPHGTTAGQVGALPSTGGTLSGSLTVAGEISASAVKVTGTVTAARLTGNGAVPYGTITLWYGQLNEIPAGWALCNGQNGTPDLRDRFVVGAGGSYSPKQHGEPDQHTHMVNLPGSQYTTTSAGAHTHKLPKDWYGRRFEDGNRTGIDVGGGSQMDAITHDTAVVEPAPDHSHIITITNQTIGTLSGGGTNRPKWYALCFIMKV